MATARTQTTRPAAPQAAPRPAPPKPATPTPARASGGPPAVRLGGAKGAPADVAPGVLDLKGMTDFAPPEPLAEFLATHRTSTVNARFGSIAEGPLQVRTAKKGKYHIKRQPLSLTHPAFARVSEFAPGLAPALFIGVEGQKITGEVGLAAGAKFENISHYIRKAPETLGLAGFTLTSMPRITNAIEGGSLHFGLAGVPIRLGSAFTGTFNFEVIDSNVTFDGNAAIVVKGLANGTLDLKRAADGSVTGKAAIALTLPSNFSGSVDVAWDGVSVTGLGKVGYKGEKFSGYVTLILMEKNQAQQLAKTKTAPEGTEQKPAAAASSKKPSKIDYVVFGEGDLSFSFTDWLYGTAHVIADPKGNITVIGEIRPQKEFYPFGKDPKEWNKELFKLEARATYGLPVVADVFIYAKASMDLFAKLGPVRFYNIVIEGTYSTDPTVANNFSIRGSLNISAVAGARLRAEAGVGIEILSHDIKAGAGINGIAGIKAYAEATPIVGYREKGVEGQDLKGEWFIRGELEVAAQPFLGLSGDLFLELETPWWSPLSDDKWTWPLFNKEWPLGGTMGVLVTVDYIFGSGQWPKFDFKPVEFDSDKFMTSMYDDKAQSGSGKEAQQQGKWAEKNSAAAQPPPKASPPGNAKPGKPGDLAPAKGKKVAGKKGGKPADPNARTKGGKSVKQLQDEAIKKGKKGQGKDLDKGAGKKEVSSKPVDGVATSEEVRAQAKNALARELKSDHTFKETKAIVKGIAARLKPIGLHRLEIGHPDANGKSTILAEASPLIPLAYLLPLADAPTGRAVRTTIEITLEQPAEIEGGRIPAAQAGTARGVSGGGRVLRQTEDTVVQLVTWNTANINTKNNRSHAEHQFAAWVNRQDKDFLKNIKKIVLSNHDRSPCANCSEDLVWVLEYIGRMRGRRFSRAAEDACLYWAELHSGISPTTWQSIRELSKAGWKLSAVAGQLPTEKYDTEDPHLQVHLVF